MTSYKNFYGRRQSHSLSPLKEKALTKLSSLDIEPWKENWPSPLWIEIGFGFGEHLIQWMSLHPSSFIIGVEVFKNGVAHLLQYLPPLFHQRCRIFANPIEELWSLLPEASIEGIIVLFPDPWPKYAHRKRRLIQSSFLKECHRVLRKEGTLSLATDHHDLMGFMLQSLHNSPFFTWKEGLVTAEEPWPSIWPWPSSRYLEKALKQGKQCATSVWKNG